MSHFALLDSKGIVKDVISAELTTFPLADGFPAIPFPTKFAAPVVLGAPLYLQTSYNSKFRGTYAGIGFTYNPATDVFMPPAVVIPANTGNPATDIGV